MSKKYTVIISVLLVAALILVGFSVIADKDDMPVVAEKSEKSRFCMLILGKDKVSGLSDVMMLASFDIQSRKISIMQIPRDTYADYGSKSHKKLNTAAAVLGGEDRLCKFLSESLDITIDGYASLELEGFRKIIDTLGGVEIDLPRALDYEDPEQGLYIHLPAGKQVLDGKAAEKVVRFRSGYVRGDLDRLDMQKRFLAALFSTVKDKVSPTNAYGLAVGILPYVKTNISLPLAVALGIKALEAEVGDLNLFTLPGEAVVSDVDRGSYYVMSASGTKRIIEEYFLQGEANIDPRKVFRHPSNKKFSDIYDGDTEEQVIFGDMWS